jgi:hypothetical protein
MNNVKKFLANKKPGFYVMAVAFLLGLISLIVYVARGGNYLSPVSGIAVTLLALGVAASVLSMVLDFGLLGILPVALFASAFAVLLNTEMLFISNVAFGVDGNSIDGGFIFFVVGVALAVLTSAIAFGMGLSKSNKILAEE